MLRTSSSRKNKCSARCAALLITTDSLPDAQFYLVDPNVVIGHGALAIHLECDVQLPHRGSLWIVETVDDPARPVYRDRDEMHFASTGPLELPTQAMPHVCSLRVGAGNTGVLPMQRRIPDPPGPGAMEIALCAEDKFLAVHGLVHVELERLDGGGIIEVEAHVVDEVRDGI